MNQQNGQLQINLFNLTVPQLKEIFDVGLDLTSVYLLEGYTQGTDVCIHLGDCNKLLGHRQTLLRKGFINENGEPTVLGISFIEELGKESGAGAVRVKMIKEQVKEDFDLWWQNFPGTDGFIYKNRKFEKTRTLRVDKDTCRKIFTDLVNKKEYTASEIILALKKDVEMRKEASIKQGQNKLTYLQNSATYLRQKSFDPFIDEIRANHGTEVRESADIYSTEG